MTKRMHELGLCCADYAVGRYSRDISRELEPYTLKERTPRGDAVYERVFNEGDSCCTVEISPELLLLPYARVTVFAYGHGTDFMVRTLDAMMRDFGIEDLPISQEAAELMDSIANEKLREMYLRSQ